MFATPSRTFFALPFWIAERMGFFEAEGIRPSMEIVGSSADIRARLRDGSVRLAIDTADGVMADAVAGGPLRIAAGNAQRPPLFLIARPEITTLAALRGKTFGVLSLNEGSSKLIPKILASVGLAPEDFRIVEAGGAPARVAALKEGRIDAALQPMPLHYEAVAEGFNNLAWAGDYQPDWQFNTVNVNAELSRRDPRPIVAALRALRKGLDFMRTAPDECARIGADALGTQPAYVARAIADAATMELFHPRYACSEAGLRNIFENMQANGALPRDLAFDLAQVTAPEFLNEADRA